MPPSAALVRLVKLMAVVFVVTVLHVGQEIFKPLALSILLSFLLFLPMRALERRGIRRPLAVAGVTCLAFLALGLLAWLFLYQVLNLARALPQYRQNIIAKVREVRESSEGTPVARVAEMLREVGSEWRTPRAAPLPTREPEPVPTAVAVVGEESPLEALQASLAPLLAPLGMVAAVVVLVVFFLLEWEELRNRLIRLVGESQLLTTTQAFFDAGNRLSRYLLMQLLVNITYSVPLTLGLYWIGIPNAFLWGLLALLLRYLPYVGPWLAATPPFLLSLAVFPGWQPAALTAFLFLVLEIVINNLVEPLAYGSRLGVSPAALIVSALFWTWLWGFVGLMLAAPMTVCLVVLGRHVPHFEFLNVLFGDEPALPPPMRLYQRLLAEDPLEAMALVEAFCTDHGRTDLFDGLLLPVLALAEQDRSRKALSEEQERFVQSFLLSVVEDAAPPAGSENRKGRPLSALVIPAATAADELAAAMLARLVEREGGGRLPVKHPRLLVTELAEAITSSGAGTVCICAVPPSSHLQVRSLCKRLRAQFPDLRILVAFPGRDLDTQPTATSYLLEAGATTVVSTLSQVLLELFPERRARARVRVKGAGSPLPA